MSAPVTSLADAKTARVAADHERAEWLVSLADGFNSQADLFQRAGTLGGRPLLRIPLRQVLLATKGIGDQKAAHILARVQTVLGVKIPVRKMTVGWLLDSRAGGRRAMAWQDVTTSLRSEPWPGFPYSSRLVNAVGGHQSSANRGEHL
ncbi:hypothetical protein [Leifsonia sp. Leaf264]|uniref:hypothetical protein n=1 Tax=Leifsonia sp. Leaf264 TaxID=1736314 RepID=UPI0006F3F537|nr:hypothetical protein [Leifsonia sp. Leaf264]KQO98870.1 hypothetical protein ASF30_12470 [Leifsonia sp. Leaf264]